MRNMIRSMMTLAGLLVVAAPAMAQGAPKLGYINTQRVIQETPGAGDAQVTLQREQQAIQAQLTAMDDSLRAMGADYQQKQLVMSADAKQKREQEILAKQTEYRQRAQQLEQQFGRRQQEVMEPLMKKVEDAINAVRTAEGYAIIFDAASEAIVSADPSLDLTQKVIDRLKAGAPAAAPGGQ